MSEKNEFRVLLVCTGNTCRSPMALGIATKLAAERKADHLVFRSAGTAAVPGSPPTDYAIEAARHWDVDISGHRSTLLTRELVSWADIILCMGHEHVQAVWDLDGAARGKTFMFSGFPNPYNPAQSSIKDPIGQDLEQYNQTFLELDEILRRIFPRLMEISLVKK